jgi:glycosyltransferase involved in cell wall biosynthesis
VAVGRLVEKKGFAYLIEAAAALEEREPLDTVTIVGDGPLEANLRELAERLGVAHRVRLLGAREPDEVRGLLEEADLLAMPCVVAADGDRDSMPVVVKEALAMEVPVVASDEVGLPEVVRPEWGRLAPPRDTAALAAAIGEVLALPREERAAMGRAGRAFVVEAAGVDREADRLWSLVKGSRP